MALIDDSSAFFDSEVDMAFFPSLQVCRHRGSYQMDAVKTQKTCSKKYKGHPSLLPGVFTLYCPHGKICYTNYHLGAGVLIGYCVGLLMHQYDFDSGQQHWSFQFVLAQGTFILA